MTERDSERRRKIAHWVLKRVAAGTECLPFGIKPKGVIEMLVAEEPGLLEEDGLTPLAKIRKAIEEERRLQQR